MQVIRVWMMLYYLNIGNVIFGYIPGTISTRHGCYIFELGRFGKISLTLTAFLEL